MFMGETHRAPARSPEHVLDVRSLAKRYGPRDALTGLSLSVDPGEIVGLVGSNGSGKTTSLRILSGLLRPDAGEGVVLGFDIMRESAQVRRLVGYLSQRDSLGGTGCRRATGGVAPDHAAGERRNGHRVEYP